MCSLAVLVTAGEEGNWVGDGLGRKPAAVAENVSRPMYCEEVLCCRELTVVEVVQVVTDQWTGCLLVELRAFPH